jgi:alpha-tubulin suppressor-like RCC1 family protein
LSCSSASSVPCVIADLEHIPIKKIAAGGHSAALSTEGEVFVWGEGPFGEFKSPYRVKTISGNAVDIAIGNRFGLALTGNGAIFVWGSNEDGELGVGDFQERVAPFPLLALKDKRVLSISAGYNFTVAVGEKQRKPLGGSSSGITRALISPEEDR